jgi:hypothetical protein
MAIYRAISTLILSTMLGGCAGTFTVTVSHLDPQRKVMTAAIVPQDFNSPEMDANIKNYLSRKGITVRQPLPAGTRQSSAVDTIVAYTDLWRWDLRMYLHSLEIDLLDGASGQPLVTGTWQNSRLHSFPDPQTAVNRLLDEMFSKFPMPN